MFGGGGSMYVDESMRYCAYFKCKGTLDIPEDNFSKMVFNEKWMRDYREEKDW